ncbi:MAG: NAD(+) synthase, partial [Clostridia bacterium]|nr:NAD(+) synthase [Clostridia bacterium]
VSYLVKYYADTTDNEKVNAVLRDILDTPISPELIPPSEDGEILQKTEDKVGPYELHDFFLFYMLRAGFEPEKILYIAEKTFAGRYSRAELVKWLENFYRRFFSQQYKRSCMPDGPKVGSVAFSPRGDLRMPSDAAVKIWMDSIRK